MARAGLYGLTILLTALLPGCRREPSRKLAPVSGRVVYRGRGLSMATVQLLADTAKGTHAPAATGQTGEDGSFTLQTPPHGSGVAPGHYKVTVQHYFSGVPPLYGNPAKTPLCVEVPEAGLPNWKLQLKD